MYTGSWLGDGVQFCIDEALEPIQACPCSQGRKARGPPFAANKPVQSTASSLISDADLLKFYGWLPGKRRIFCGRCDSPIYSFKKPLPGHLRIRAGLINEPLPVGPTARFYVGSKAGW